MDDTQKAAGLTIGGLFTIGLLAFFLTQTDAKTETMLVPFDLPCGNATGLVYCHMVNYHYANPSRTDMYFLVIPPVNQTDKVSLTSASMAKKTGTFAMRGTVWHEITALENVTINEVKEDFDINGTKFKVETSRNMLNITWLVEPSKEIDLKKRYVAIASADLFAQGDVRISLGGFSDE